MPYLPSLNEGVQARSVVEQFGGYNHNLRINEGEWYDDLNLTSDYFPMFARRKPRTQYRGDVADPQGILAKDALAWVDGPTLFYNGLPVSGLILSTRENDCPKQLVSMGAYIIIWPDAKYVNTKDLTDCGSLGAQFSSVTDARVTFTPCRLDGSEYEGLTVSSTAPSGPANGAYWMDTSSSPHVLKQYSASSAAWVEVATTYVRIGVNGIGTNFAEFDGVTLSGIRYTGSNEAVKAQLEDLNTDVILYGVGEDYIIVTGVLDEAYTQTSGSVSVERVIPRMDYICESNNRLWGCYYGMSSAGTLNEIYACKLGDPKNWHCFMGLSTDSYMVSVGTDGAFTGAIAHAGYPLFFKEGCVHKMYGSYPGNYQLQTTTCRGVQKGSWRSLVIVNEVLYYKSRQDVCAYDGSLPVGVSEQLGNDEYYYGAVAGAFDGKYYIAMKTASGSQRLFVYDTVRGLWHKETPIDAVGFAAMDDSLMALHGNVIQDLNGMVGMQAEGEVIWSATSGLIGYEMIDQKYVSRFNLRLRMTPGSECNLYIQYDSDGVWQHQGTVVQSGTDSWVLPVIPRRCDHFMLRLEGNGDVKIYSMAKIIEQGSDAV